MANAATLFHFGSCVKRHLKIIFVAHLDACSEMVHHVGMTLSEYLRRNSISAPGFAKLIKVTRPTVVRYCSGTRVPRREIMERIKIVTDGKVKPGDFYK